MNVQYQKSCGSGKKFVVSYTNQVVINSTTFSAGGDSGSLIVSNNSPSCHQPVALLFAGSSSSTIGNPIGPVLSAVSTALGSAVSFVGGNCTASIQGPVVSDNPQDGELSSESVERATAVMRVQEYDLMTRKGVIGVGIGASDNGSAEASIVVYIDSTAVNAGKVPKKINGVRVRKVFTDPFVAY